MPLPFLLKLNPPLLNCFSHVDKHSSKRGNVKISESKLTMFSQHSAIYVDGSLQLGIAKNSIRRTSNYCLIGLFWKTLNLKGPSYCFKNPNVSNWRESTVLIFERANTTSNQRKMVEFLNLKSRTSTGSTKALWHPVEVKTAEMIEKYINSW